MRAADVVPGDRTALGDPIVDVVTHDGLVTITVKGPTGALASFGVTPDADLTIEDREPRPFVTCACGHSNLRHSAALPRGCWSCECSEWRAPTRTGDGR